jgi:hypothetical protein
MKRSILITALSVAAIAAATISPVMAQQPRDFRAEYEAFRQSVFDQYNSFRDSCNMAYAKFMRESWERFHANEPIFPPIEPKPVTPPVYTPPAEPQPEPEPVVIPFDEIITPPDPEPRPEPVKPVVPRPDPGETWKPVGFEFYNTQCVVQTDIRAVFRLRSIEENDIADAWDRFGRLDPAVASCLSLRDKLSLCDWGYMQLAGVAARTLMGGNNLDEAALVQAYILLQSGYRLRLARCADRLTLLVSFSEQIYGCRYLTLDDGANYYVIDSTVSGNEFYVYNTEFHGERPGSMHISTLPRFTPRVTQCGSFSSERWPDLTATVCGDLSLLQFFTDYPQVRWDIYAAASISDAVRESLYPALRTAIAGRSAPEAANILINFVQTAFEYQTDPEQFGRERTLFGDELFHYAASDCEDRSVLYSILVRELLGLEVVLLDYPGHIATAVCFGDAPPPGDYILYDGRRFTICDPTYINADIGLCMPDYKRTPPGVIVIE